ncbi:MAG: beta-ketoacyl-[acyl-carrier-protein] synthase family protein [Myxococcota bacterium]
MPSHSVKSSAVRVAVTGVGLVTALGADAKASWEGLVAGRSGLRPISGYDPSGEKVAVGGEVEPETAKALRERLPSEIRARTARFVHFACAAAAEALESAGRPEREDQAAVGVVAGVGIGVPHPSEGYRVGPTTVMRLLPNGAAGWISILEGLRGPSFTCSTACASGAHAIGLAFDQIRLGRARAMVVGGVDTVITRDVVRAYTWMRALNSARDEEPSTMSRPFDATRRGFVLGEGAGFLVLEEMEHARARGARVLAEMRGWGASSDAHSFVAVAPEGAGLRHAIERALADASLPRELIDYVSAHGTSTRMNDREETRALRRVFGDRADKLMVSSQKSMLGHAMGAAGAIEAVATVLSVANQIVTPTINLHHSDPECDLDYVPHVARKASIRAAINQSAGFGGHNCAMIFTHPEAL